MRFWRQAKPGSKVTSGLKSAGICNERFYGGRDDCADARYRCQPSHVGVTFCRNDNYAFEVIDPLLRALNLVGKFVESQSGHAPRLRLSTHGHVIAFSQFDNILQHRFVARIAATAAA